MPRVTVFTDNPHRADYWLHDPVSEAELAALGDTLAEGMRVLLVRPGVFELEAVLRFQHEVNCWVGYSVR